MNFFKLLLILALLLFGSFAQRFFRHSVNDDVLIDGKDSDDNLLSSDGINAQQFGRDVKLTGYVEEIELELDELKFEYCSKRGHQNVQVCMDKKVYACYNTETPSLALQGDCRPNQCSFESGISKSSLGLQTPFVWFMDSTSSAQLNENADICPTAIMKSPKADVTVLAAPPPSCQPLITNGKIKLSVRIATTDCFLTVKNAKIWTPTTTQSPTTHASPASEAKGTKEEASNATLIWAIVGSILFILLIGIIAFVVWYFCIRKQKKTSEKKKLIVEPPKSTAEADVAKDKTEEKQEPAKPKMTTEDTKEKKKAIEVEKKPKAPKKEKKIVQEIQLEPSKEIAQENVAKEVPPKKQAPIEPTLDDPTTGASITAQENEQPHVSVPNTVIHPAPLQPASKGITQYSKSSSRKGSLSGRHEIGMQTMVEKPSETIKRRSPGSIDDATKDKLEKFYPSDSARPRPLEKREIMLFCCTKISVMFKSIELLIDVAIEKLAEHGAKFGDNETVVELSAEAERYVQKPTTPEYIRNFAFGGIFRELIDSAAEAYESCPIPLLFVIVLQRRYSVRNRRQACTWIRRQMPIIFAEFSLKERKMLPYPVSAIEQAYNMDPDGFKNISALFTESGMEEESTQDSKTRASEKHRKKQSGGGKKKKRSKKRH